MDFFLVGILYWVLISVSALLLIGGLWKQSWKMVLWSGIALIPPAISLYFGGAEGWFILSGLVPLAIFGLAIYTKGKGN